MIVNKRDIEKIMLHIEYKIIVETSRMISHFRSGITGRFFRFAPFTTGGGAFEGFIVFSNPNEAPPKTYTHEHSLERRQNPPDLEATGF